MYNKKGIPPRLSIIMPVYNAERYVEEALKSLLSQTFDDFELIIINDGSTDNTLKILNDFLEDKRIFIHSQSNQGVVTALNKGVKLAKGKHIARADADDYFCPTRLKIQYQFIERHSNIALLTSNFYKLYPDGFRLLVELPTCHNSLLHDLFIANRIMHGSVMIRKDSLLKAGGYSASWKHLEDYELWFRLTRVGQISNIPEPLSTMRIHEGSLSARYELEQVRKGVSLRIALILSHQYPIKYVRYLVKPVLKSVTPRLLLISYRKLFHKRR